MGYVNGALDFHVAGREQPKTGYQPLAEANLLKPQARGYEGPLEVDDEHGNQGA